MVKRTPRCILEGRAIFANIVVGVLLAAYPCRQNRWEKERTCALWGRHNVGSVHHLRMGTDTIIASLQQTHRDSARCLATSAPGRPGGHGAKIGENKHPGRSQQRLGGEVEHRPVVPKAGTSRLSQGVHIAHRSCFCIRVVITRHCGMSDNMHSR